MNWTRGRFHLTDRRYKDDRTTQSPEDLSELYFPAVNRYSISYTYDNDWFGFPILSKVDCQEPLILSVSNTKYPTDVDRIIPADFLEDTKRCERFVNKYGYQRYRSVSSEELEFPIAFIILFHKDLDQVRLVVLHTHALIRVLDFHKYLHLQQLINVFIRLSTLRELIRQKDPAGLSKILLISNHTLIQASCL